MKCSECPYGGYDPNSDFCDECLEDECIDWSPDKKTERRRFFRALNGLDLDEQDLDEQDIDEDDFFNF